MANRSPLTVDPPIPRPRSLAEANAIVERVFAEQSWDERERQVYCRIHDGDLETKSGVRRILNAMESSRMVLFL